LFRQLVQRNQFVTDAKEPANKLSGAPELEPVLILDAQQLFQGRKEIVIMHAGVRYRLRLTRRNKLILQK
jgi:hemin uptake protein HemP